MEYRPMTCGEYIKWYERDNLACKLTAQAAALDAGAVDVRQSFQCGPPRPGELKVAHQDLVGCLGVCHCVYKDCLQSR